MTSIVWARHFPLDVIIRRSLPTLSCSTISSSCVLKSDLFKTRQRRAQEKADEIARRGRIRRLDPSEADIMDVYQFASEKPMTKIFTWGMACFGALGVASYVRPKRLRFKNKKRLMTMHHPVRCNFAEQQNVVDVACGYGFTMFGLNDKNHHIMGCGVNKDGQIGYAAVRSAHPLEILIQPFGTRLPIREGGSHKVVQVGAGRAHTLALTSDGEVFSQGNNAYGQCGRKAIEKEDYFRNQSAYRIKGPWKEKNDQIQSVTCGQDHSIFKTTSGKLYSSGWGADGQLGQGHYDSNDTIERVIGDVEHENITKVVSSADCVLALNDKGEVFGWGNSEYGQFSQVTSEQQVSTPIKLPLDGLGKIIDIASGGTICLVLNENHDVFVWGYGILGKGPVLDHSLLPVQIPNTLFGKNEINPNVRVEKVFAGVNTCATINSLGELHMWGRNKGSCLGLGDHKDQFFPMKVSLAAKVRKVSLGVDHTVAICTPWI